MAKFHIKFEDLSVEARKRLAVAIREENIAKIESLRDEAEACDKDPETAEMKFIMDYIQRNMEKLIEVNF